MHNKPAMHQITLYTPAHQDACMALFDSNCPHYFSTEERQPFLDWLQTEEALGGRYFVLSIDNKILAAGGYFPRPEQKQTGLSWGMVHQDHHKKGFGTILTTFRLQAIAKEFPNWPCAINTSQHTKAFYERHGFVIKSMVLNAFGEGLHDCWMVHES
ncbi:MAG: GNAT family N-acetyltransferase [Aureispira sp.]